MNIAVQPPRVGVPLARPARPKLSVFICVRNEEVRLEQCLRNLRFADEIVVLLDRCTDSSRAVAEVLADRVVEGAFPIEGERRAAAQFACSGDWVLEIDADEDVPPELAEEILAFIASDPAVDWRAIPVDNYVGSRLVRHGWGGGFGVTSVQRIYRRNAKSWGAARVHPPVRLTGRGGPPMRSALRHWVDSDVSDMIRRLDRYTALRAQDLIDQGGDVGIASNMFRGVRRFWKCFVSRKGYREGAWGALIALMAALYPLLSALRARTELSTRTRDA